MVEVRVLGLTLYEEESSSKLGECGNPLLLRISKDGGKGGKPVVGFPGFPPSVISTANWLGPAVWVLSCVC